MSCEVTAFGVKLFLSFSYCFSSFLGSTNRREVANENGTTRAGVDSRVKVVIGNEGYDHLKILRTISKGENFRELPTCSAITMQSFSLKIFGIFPKSRSGRRGAGGGVQRLGEEFRWRYH